MGRLAPVSYLTLVILAVAPLNAERTPFGERLRGNSWRLPDPAAAQETKKLPSPLRPKVDRAMLFKARSKLNLPDSSLRDERTTLLPTETAVIDPCKLSKQAPLCRKERQRQRPHVPDSRTPVNEEERSSEAPITTTEISTRRALPVTMARLQYGRSQNSTRAFPSKSSPTVLYSNFYESKGEELITTTPKESDAESIAVISAPSGKAPEKFACSEGSCSSNESLEEIDGRGYSVRKPFNKANTFDLITSRPPNTKLKRARVLTRESSTKQQHYQETYPATDNTDGQNVSGNVKEATSTSEITGTTHKALTSQHSRESRGRKERIFPQKNFPLESSQLKTKGAMIVDVTSEPKNTDTNRFRSLENITSSPAETKRKGCGDPSSRAICEVSAETSRKSYISDIHTRKPSNYRGYEASYSARSDPFAITDGGDIYEPFGGDDFAHPMRSFSTHATVSRSESPEVRSLSSFPDDEGSHNTAIRTPQLHVVAFTNPMSAVKSGTLRDVYSRKEPHSAIPPNHITVSDPHDIQPGDHPVKLKGASTIYPNTKQHHDTLTSPSMRTDDIVSYQVPPSSYFYPLKKTTSMTTVSGSKDYEVLPLHDKRSGLSDQSLDSRPDRISPVAGARVAQSQFLHAHALSAPVAAGTSFPIPAYQTQPTLHPFTQPLPENILTAQRQQEDQQVNFAAQAILGALQLQANMLQRQHDNADVSASNLQHSSVQGYNVPLQPLTPKWQMSMLNPMNSKMPPLPVYDNYLMPNLESSTTKRPREKHPRKKKNKKKQNHEQISLPGKLLEWPEDHAVSFTDDDIVFERPLREPEIVFERPGHRKPYGTSHRAEMTFDAVQGTSLSEGVRRPAFHVTQPYRQAGTFRPKSKPLSRPPYEIVTLHRQKRQEGYLYPKPNEPALTGTTQQPSSLASTPTLPIAPVETVKGNEDGYNYPKPGIPFPPSPIPNEEPLPASTKGPADPLPPSSQPDMTPAPLPVRPKPTPPPDLIPRPSSEGYDYPKPERPLPLPQPVNPDGGSVTLPGPSEEPEITPNSISLPETGSVEPFPEGPTSPSPQQTEQPGSALTEGYNYPIPSQSFST